MAVLRHAPADKALLDLVGKVEVAHAFSRSAAQWEAFAQRFAFPTCERLETVLDDASVAAVLVLTPPNTHLDIARRCAEAGKPLHNG